MEHSFRDMYINLTGFLSRFVMFLAVKMFQHEFHANIQYGIVDNEKTNEAIKSNYRNIV